MSPQKHFKVICGDQAMKLKSSAHSIGSLLLKQFEHQAHGAIMAGAVPPTYIGFPPLALLLPLSRVAILLASHSNHMVGKYCDS